MAIPGGAIVQALFRPHRSIGPLQAMVTIQEDHHDEIAITDHPVEYMANISDHAIKLPSELRIRAGWSKSPNLTGPGVNALFALDDNLVNAVLGPGGALDYTQIVYQQLRALQLQRIPMDVITGKRIYVNMLIQSLSTTTTQETENALLVDIVLREVIITTTYVQQIGSANQQSPELTKGQVNNGTKEIRDSGLSFGVFG
jgi:hypothetical protein